VNRSLQAILRRVIAKGFPELKRLRIAIGFGPLDRDTCFFYYIEAGRYQITVADALRPAPRRALEGGIAHELSHILRDSRLGPYQRKLAFDRYARSASFRTRDERATELRQIERGYGPQLLAFLSYARTLGFRFTREHGLLRAEIARCLQARRLSAAPARPRALPVAKTL
jgi:hypothetical protein